MLRFTTPGVMGILNVTPDSFADGGRWATVDAAIDHGREMLAQGASIIDVGGESTRPGAHGVEPAEELRRVIPVITELARHGAVSIDTRHLPVAEAAVEAGAVLINDVSATLWPVAASASVSWVAMHTPAPGGSLSAMHVTTRFVKAVDEVLEFVVELAERALAAGVADVFIDPGLGFGKDTATNVALVAGLARFTATGFPVLVGASRKRFVGVMAGGDTPNDRLDASLAIATWAFAQGVALVRAHDVAASVAARRLVLEQVDRVGEQAA